MLGRKYKLLKAELITDPYAQSRELKIYRIKALRNIPHHNVLKGDLGGYVTDKVTLSQHGECWIGGDAIVHGAAVTGNAFVGGEAIVYAGLKTTSEMMAELDFLVRTGLRSKVSDLARITIKDEVIIMGKARLTAFSASGSNINPVKIKGRALIGGSAKLRSPALINEDAYIYDNAVIETGARITDKARIYDNAVVGTFVNIAGTTNISGEASVGNNSMIFGNLNLSGNVKVAANTKIDNEENLFISEECLIEPGNKKLSAEHTTGNAQKDTINRILETTGTNRAFASAKRSIDIANQTIAAAQRDIELHRVNDYPAPKEASPDVNSSKMKKYVELLQETSASLKSYETDIVKIIKYPVMVDRTNEHTASMLTAKRVVSLVDPATEELEFYTAVLNFDKAFHTAEAHALKVSISFLSPEEQKKTQKARDLFSIAVDVASTENEKVNAFKQGFKQLEGIILVPEQAVTALRVKAGIAELEV